MIRDFALQLLLGGMIINPFTGPGTPPVETPEYTNPGGQGDRTGIITCSYSNVTGSPIGAGTPNNLVDGAIVANSTDACQVGNGRGNEFTFDFGVGVNKVISEVTFDVNSTAAHGTWQFYASHDNANWFNIASDQTFTGAISYVFATTLTTVTGGFRYFKLHQRDGTASTTIWNLEIKFKICNGTAYVNANRLVFDYANPGGKGPRNAMCTITTDLAPSGASGPITGLLDGCMNSNDETGFTASTGNQSKEIRWDFKAGNSKRIDQILFTTAIANVIGGSWAWEGSNDGTAWTTINSGLTLNGTSTTYNVTGTTGYRFFRMLHGSGTNIGVLVRQIEWEFRIRDTT